MNKKEAETLIDAYVDGWRKNDGSKILATLAPDCVIVESHGPTYRGIETVRKWVERWIAEGSRVDRWDITSFRFTDDVAVFEWGFECTAGGRHYQIDGISWVEMDEAGIVVLREYRRTELPYEWSPAG
jgi:uncharacterized protein (TIGR02246 family)